jgi:hypothetical protein
VQTITPTLLAEDNVLKDELYLRLMDEEDDSWRKLCDYDLFQLYRVGKATSGVPTCTPRLLLVDSAENLSSFNAHTGLFHHPELDLKVDSAWDGRILNPFREKTGAVRNSLQRFLDSEADPRCRCKVRHIPFLLYFFQTSGWIFG